MPEKMTFSPRKDNLSLKELSIVANAFVDLGVKKIRLTGGEPMIHPDFAQFIGELNQIDGLENIAITTNASKIKEHQQALTASKVTQLNISLDSLDPATFTKITRQKPAMLENVLNGIDLACHLGIPRIRLNVVAMTGINDQELLPMVELAKKKGIHIAFIEEMPLGAISSIERADRQISSETIKQQIQQSFGLTKLIRNKKQAGPADYYLLDGSKTEIGFISPHSQNFCHLCNRVRVTRDGQLILCLGNNASVNLRHIIQTSNKPLESVKNAILTAMQDKPKSHEFDNKSSEKQVIRFMNVTGG